MKSHQYYDGQQIRLKQLKTLTRKISGSQGAIRQPVTGDLGEVVGVTNSQSMPPVIEAEMVENGKVVWRAEFAPDEVEVIPAV